MPIPSRPVLDEEGEDTSVSVEQRIDSNIAQTRVGDWAGWPAAKHVVNNHCSAPTGAKARYADYVKGKQIYYEQCLYRV